MWKNDNITNGNYEDSTEEKFQRENILKEIHKQFVEDSLTDHPIADRLDILFKHSNVPIHIVDESINDLPIKKFYNDIVIKSTDIVRTKHFDSSAKLLNPSQGFRRSPMPSIYETYDPNGLFAPSDRIGRNYSIKSIGLTMKAVVKLVKQMQPIQAQAKKNKSNGGLNYAATAPLAFNATEGIVNAALSEYGGFPPKPKKPDPPSALPSVGSITARREEHRLLRSKPNYSVLVPRKIKGIDEYNIDETKNFDDWNPEPVIIETADNFDVTSNSSLSLKEKLTIHIDNTRSFNKLVNDLIRYGIITSSGSGHKLPIVTLSNKSIDSIKSKIQTIKGLLVSEIMQSLLFNELDEVSELHKLAIAQSCILYELNDKNYSKLYKIHINNLYDRYIYNLWSNKYYQSYEYRVLRHTYINSNNIIQSFQKMNTIHCNSLQILLELQYLYLDSSLPTVWWDSMLGMTKTNYCNIKLIDVSEYSFRHRLPMILDDFISHIDARSKDIRDALLDYWIVTAAGKISYFLSNYEFCHITDKQEKHSVDVVDQNNESNDNFNNDMNESSYDVSKRLVNQRLKIFNKNSLQLKTTTSEGTKSNNNANITNQSTQSINRNKAERIVDTSVVLLSRQIRSICESSLHSFVQLFESLNKPNIAQYCIFVINLKLRKVTTKEFSTDFNEPLEVYISPDLNDFTTGISSCIHSIVNSSRSFTRPEQSLGAGFGGANSQYLQSFIANNRTKKMNECSVSLRDEIVIDIQNRLHVVLMNYIKQPMSLLDKFQSVDSLLKGKEMDNVVRSISISISSTNIIEGLDILNNLCKKLDNLINTVHNMLQDVYYYPMFEVHCSDVKELLIKQINSLHSMILDAVNESNRNHLISINAQYKEISIKLTSEVIDAVELKALQDFTSKAQVILNDLYEQYTTICYEKIKFLLLNKHKFTREDIGILFETFNWPLNIQTYLRRSIDMQTHRKKELEELLEEEQRKVENELNDINKKIDNIALIDNPVEFRKIVDRIATIKKDMMNKENVISEIIEKETLLDIPHNDLLTRLSDIKTLLDPLERLWNTIKLFVDKTHYWNETPLPEINIEIEEEVTNEIYRSFYSLSKEFDKFSNDKRKIAKDISDTLYKEVRQFQKETIPLMHLVCNPGMRDRHWNDIEAVTGLVIPRDEVLTINILTDIGLQNYNKEIEDICISASKEYSLQTTLDKMENEWSDMIFNTKDYRSTGTRILTSIDEIQQLLDDQIVKVHAMHSSRYIKPFLERVVIWEETLTSMQDIIDNWLKVQATWLYLEPIFSSDDIMRQMPTEGKLFRSVDNTWRVSIAQTINEPSCVKVARRPGFLESLIEANNRLEIILKGLNDYLETKRLAFPRFFFLSNDELLEILSETKDPLRVQPHLKKCFDGINKLQFNSQLDILSCYDSKEEKLDFPYDKINHRKINPNESGGNVEKWLIEVEIVMKKSLAYTIDYSIKDFMQSDRIEWLHNWQGQVIICVNQIKWCNDIENILKNGLDIHSELVGYYNHLCNELLRTVELVRGDISKSLRIAISALVVMDVHNRDTVNELTQIDIKSKSDFDWLAHLRYYWNSDGESALSGKPGSIQCQMINAHVLYAYEYIGNQDRLVITPLTDRCYRTLMNAIHLNLGGAPEGPAGTGKTETVKDLAKAIAIQCVVTNCSDGLDYLAMAKFFKGLASSGSWACFDEFNRIQLEVLSVIAQQILQIQMAKIKTLTKFVFEGTELELKPTCCPFITMNPGYAGRAELPDNLKVLFRTVAMMVPDYAMISEIILYSYGYTNAKPLAIKIVTTYKLCSEQLSSQSHYDYGMRAVIAVLRAAGNLKRIDSNQSEDILVLRSIIDVNLPKFLSPDVPLFNGIVSDLFPGVTISPPDLSVMKEAFNYICNQHKLIPESYFWEKVIQIYDMMIVRHGFMIVGLPFSGKTSSWKVLSEMLTHLSNQYPDDKKWSKVIPFIQNPKSITMGQLYGQFDAVSHEWTDGVLAINYRNAASNKIGNPEDRKWILFDGPVDAIWIENMNTVLDDNKKLCLMSGEIIAMTDVMSMIFEPMDLLAASPATVSRCGMIYLEPEKLSWQPFLLSWLETYKSDGIFMKPRVFTADDHEHDDNEKINVSISSIEAKHIQALFDWLVEPCLCFLRKDLIEMSPTVDTNLVVSLLNIFETMLSKAFKKYEKEDGQSPDNKSNKLRQVDIENCFLFSLVWSIGVTSNAESQIKFSQYLDNIINDIESIENDNPSVYNALLVRKWKTPDFSDHPTMNGHFSEPMPKKSTYFEYIYLPESSDWKLWEDLLPSYNIKPNSLYNEIVVPSNYTAQYQYFLELLIPRKKNILVCGGTGTGKSVYINNILYNILSKKKYKTLNLNFSAKTSANMTQDIIDGKLDKRRKGVYGPPLGQSCVIFIDDLNMPEVEVYGAQPPIELLRQLVDSKGWYDLKEKTWKSIVDTSLIAAMGPSGGGRNSITPRFLRHFNLICFNEFNDDTLRKIFTTIIDWHFTTFPFPFDVKNLATNGIIEATIDIYRLAMDNLLPTPNKSHYTFNLRDFSRIIQGILLVRPTTNFTTFSLIKLWTHEALRVINDRLIDDTDRQWFHNSLNDIFSSRFSQSMNDIFIYLKDSDKDSIDHNDLRKVLYGDYLTSNVDSYRPYIEIVDHSLLYNKINDYLVEYNSLSKKPMDLVIFNFAIEHISRICRILKMPGGHALLVGVGGSGRQSLTRLAVFICQFQCYQIEISKNYTNVNWREDLKYVLKSSGTSTKPFVFLFSDTQIKNESFVEDISNILNTGEVPNIFSLDEKTSICDSIRTLAKQAFGKEAADMNIQDLFNFFLSRIKTNLHVILAFSPIGDSFRDRLRKFPSLSNNCTIDWFTSWPSDALLAVAKTFLSSVQFDNDETRQAIVSLCQTFHLDVSKLSEQFYNQLKRRNYVTPTSYLELIIAYKQNLDMKRVEVLEARSRYEIGLDKLTYASQQINQMHKELEDLQPELIESAAQTEILMTQIEKKMPGVLETRKVVGEEAAIAQKEADIVQKQKNEVEADLAAAIPALEEADAALNTIKPNDINEIKALSKPPDKIKMVCKAVCIMLDIKPARIPDPENPSKRIMDYWGPSQRMLSDSNFIDLLIKYPKDNIDIRVVNEIKRDFLSNPDFNPEVIQKASKAAEGMCRWIIAMITYDQVAKEVAPKKLALLDAETKLNITMNELNSKKAALLKVENELKLLQTQLDAAKRKKIDLEHQASLCDAKILRATQLLDGLGGEKDRWNEFALKLTDQYKRLTGDVLISSGVLAYLGTFTANYRQEQLKKWIKLLKDNHIPCSDNPSLSNTLGNPVKIRQWNIDGLPTDNFSIDNGIIVFNARRWPLMIDPQGQANKWIRNMEKQNNLQVIKLSDANYLRTLENFIPYGTPVLLENVNEELDPSLESLLNKQIFKVNGVNSIRLGDTTVEYSENFRFYITTKLRNPHYLPEISVKVTLLNFMITPEGLQDQLLGIVVSQERPDLEDQRNLLIIESADNKKHLKEIEDKILSIMSSSSGNILEDETAIQTLKDSKNMSNEISKKQAIAEETEANINSVRQSYSPIAYSSQILFFCIADLANIEPVYQYSLLWFINLFITSINQSEKGKDVDKRLFNLNEHFTYLLYKNVCRSLLEKDKLLFSFLLTSRIMLGQNKIDMNEWFFLLTGTSTDTSPINIPDNPASEWLSNKNWEAINRFSTISPIYKDFPNDFIQHINQWKDVYDSLNSESEIFPGMFKDIKGISRLCALRCIRPDKLVNAIQVFVTEIMTDKFIKPPVFDIQSCYNDSTPFIPLVFILSPGSDPMGSVMRAAEVLKTTVEPISLGQGQGIKAEKLIIKAKEKGTWIVLQNCHLAPSWMSTLEKICEELSDHDNHDDVNPGFRLWCTTYPSEVFPISVLQNGVKMTNEPPKGIRANLLSSYRMDPIANETFYNSCIKGYEFRRLLYGLCFFHALIQERRLYGPLGWNIPYEFNESDLRISVQQLVLFLNENSQIPYKALNYTAGECNYGGRVTDDKDRRTLLCILKRFYCSDFLQIDYDVLSSTSNNNTNAYVCPLDGSYNDYIDYIDKLPIVTTPELFGLHENATLTKDQNDTNLLLNSMLDTEQGSTNSSNDNSVNKEDVILSIAIDIYNKLPNNYNIEYCQIKYPVKWEESMNTVLCQELVRFNNLLTLMRTSLINIQKGIKGLVVMSNELEIFSNSLYINRIPILWKSRSYPSLKSLSGYILDQSMRLSFFNDWLMNKPPSTFWISGFFFTQAFLTGALQNYARRYIIPIDDIVFDFKMLPDENYTTGPDNGIYSYGLFLEGCRWDKETNQLAESYPKVLFTPAPIIHWMPYRKIDVPIYSHYKCPVYKTSDRRGVLATTGHSSNFVCYIYLPSDLSEDHWVERGVAMLTQLDD